MATSAALEGWNAVDDLRDQEMLGQEGEKGTPNPETIRPYRAVV